MHNRKYLRLVRNLHYVKLHDRISQRLHHVLRQLVMGLHGLHILQL